MQITKQRNVYIATPHYTTRANQHMQWSVYRESIPGEMNGLLEYEPAPELPVLAVFA